MFVPRALAAVACLGTALSLTRASLTLLEGPPLRIRQSRAAASRRAAIIRSVDSVHYPLAVQVDGKVTYLIWTSGDEHDRVLVDGGRVVTFDDLRSLETYATEDGVHLATANPDGVFDVDVVATWLLRRDEPDPVAILNTWNLAWDMSNSTDLSFNHRGGVRDALYDKVFRANNLPAVSPPDERYKPDWSPEELALLRDVAGEAIALIQAAIRGHP
jgi:hypothetical protein